jgi:hypothetical protein
MTATGSSSHKIGHEDMMTLKITAAKVALLLATIAVAATSVDISSASAQARRQFDERGRPYYGANGPNSSYQQGPTRIYVTKRSWLDAGVEVLPGDRKFTDYAFPPGQSFARENLNRPLDRQPLNPPSDFGSSDGYGGFTGRFPAY